MNSFYNFAKGDMDVFCFSAAGASDTPIVSTWIQKTRGIELN